MRVKKGRSEVTDNWCAADSSNTVTYMRFPQSQPDQIAAFIQVTVPYHIFRSFSTGVCVRVFK